MMVSDNPPRWAQSWRNSDFSGQSEANRKRSSASFDAQPVIAGWSADSKRHLFQRSRRNRDADLRA